MSLRERILEDKDFNSSQISTACRYIGFGLLAIYYASQVVGEWSAPSYPIFLVGLSGALTILFDYLHYLCGYMTAQIAVWNHDDGWDQNSVWMHGRHLMFWEKQMTALVGALALIASITGYSASG